MSKREIPESWAIAKLEEVASVEYGKGLPERERKSGSALVVASGGIVGNHNAHLYDTPIVVTGRKGSIGSAHYIQGKSWVIDTAFALVPSEVIDPKFLYRRMSFFDFKSIEASTAIPSISREALYKVEIPVPPLLEQKRIVEKIELTQEKVNSIEASISKADELIEKYREALLQKAFRGELVPQDPKDEPASELIERIRAEREKQSDGKKKKKDEFKPISAEESSPFDIPDNWSWVKLGEVVDFQGGSQPPKTEFKYKKGPGLVRLVQIRDFKSDDHIVYISEKINKRHFDETDIMIGRYGPPIFQILRGLSGSYNVALMKAVPSLCVDREYLYWYLQEPRIQKDVNRKSERAAGQTGVNLEFLNNYMIPLPPIDEQKRIAKFINKAFSDVKEFESKIQLIKQLHKSLSSSIFSKAFTGSLVRQIPSEGTGHDLLEKVKNSSKFSGFAKTDSKKKSDKKRVKK